MAKYRYIKKSKKDLAGILYTNKIFTESIEDPYVVIRQFNSLTEKQRVNIRSEHKELEKATRDKLNNMSDSTEDLYLTCVMVDFNIIATKYNVDPATVCICIQNVCKNNEKILII